MFKKTTCIKEIASACGSARAVAEKATFHLDLTRDLKALSTQDLTKAFQIKAPWLEAHQRFVDAIAGPRQVLNEALRPHRALDATRVIGRVQLED